eukprot:gene10347-20956_t
MVVWTLALPSRSFVHGTTTTTTTTTVPAYSGSFDGEWEVAPEGSHYTKVEGSTNLYLYQIGGNKDTSSDDYDYYGFEDDDRSGGRPDVNWIITDQKLGEKRKWIHTEILGFSPDVDLDATGKSVWYIWKGGRPPYPVHAIMNLWSFIRSEMVKYVMEITTTTTIDWKVDSHLQYAYIKYTAKWTDAASFCAGEDAQLASIKSQAEQDFVRGSLMGGTFAVTWIGASDTGEEDVWVWEDGTSAAKGNAAVFSHWRASEPNDNNGEDCAVLYTDGWNDVGCERVLVTTTTTTTTTSTTSTTTTTTSSSSSTTTAATATTTIQVTTPPMQPTTTTNSNIEFAGNGTISLTTTPAASDDGGPLPPTTGATPKPTAFNSSDTNAINQAADDGIPTSAGKSFGIAITVIILLAGVAFVLHRKYPNSKSADDEARHVEAEFNERENSRNTMSMESNPLARTQSDVATHTTSLPGETRNRADTHENWPMPAEAAAAAEDSTVTTAVYVNQAFEPPSTRSNSNVVRLRAGGRQNQPAENPTPRRNSAEVSVYVEADPVYSKSQDGTVQLYENDFPRPPPPAATAAGKQQNYEDFNLIIGGIDMEAGGGMGGGQGGAAGARGGSDAGNGAHFYENHAPGYPSAVYAVPEVLTEYNSDYQIPDALTVEGVNLDYADLNNHQSLYDSSV